MSFHLSFKFLDLIVTSTGFSREKKDQIKKEVEFMAGIYSNAFHDGVTHLVAAVSVFIFFVQIYKICLIMNLKDKQL